MSTYISKNQIDGNLRRTAELQLISKLSVEELNLFAKKYYWNEEHQCYICPYTGQLIKDYNDLVLEHIIPVSSKGGTVLFNCVPAHKSINGTDQKGAKHLLDWWIDSGYFTKERLETLVNYMLDAYNQVFTTYTEEEILNSYEEFYNDEEQEQEDDLSERININEQKELQEQTKNNHIGSYLDFLISCIQELEKRNIDTTIIRNKLNNLEERNIFNQISIFETYQTTIQNIIKSYTKGDTRKYLTYSLNFNIPKLMQSLNLTDKKQIEQTLYQRFNYINTILIQNNISFKDYLDNLQDIEDINLIYLNPNNITPEQQLEFINNIKIGPDSKIQLFIETLNRGHDTIFKAKNQETYKTYAGKEDKIGKDTGVKIKDFWCRNQEQIKEVLDDREKYGEDYNRARELIKKWEFANRSDPSQRIESFIEMLNRGHDTILKNKTSETFKLYKGTEDNFGKDTGIKVGHFWSTNQEQVREVLDDREKYGEDYNRARELIKKWEFTNLKDSSQRIESFIEMLNRGNIEIFKAKNQETFKIYAGKEDRIGKDTVVKVVAFWDHNQEQIKELLNDREKYGEDYNRARELIKKWEFANQNNVSQRIESFIEMLNRGNIEIFKAKNQETFKIYAGKEDRIGKDTVVKVVAFWCRNQEQIKEVLNDREKYGEDYNRARGLIKEWEFANQNNVSQRIESFIEMLNRGNIEILKAKNQETYKTYAGKEDKTGRDTGVKIKDFLSRNQEQIKEVLDDREKYGEDYNRARELIKKWEFANQSDPSQRIESFIEMLNRGNIEIFKAKNQETYKTYAGKEDKIGKDTGIKVGIFWHKHQEQIKATLFKTEQYKDTSYDTARTIILDKYKVSSYEELQVKVKAIKETKTLKKRNKELKQVEASLNQSINTGNRKRA